MCLAIFKPAGVSVPFEHLQNGWIRNPDGAGFALHEKGRIKVTKGLMTLKEFSAALDKVKKKQVDCPMLIHFRIRSLGDRNAEQTHPFVFEHGAAIHNGTLDGTGAIHGTGDSDTNKFIAAVGSELTPEIVERCKDDLGRAVGAWNKIAFLFKNGKHVILNERAGYWHEGVWYSNRTYESRSMAEAYGAYSYD